MDVTNTPYWILEFIKVIIGYLLVEFAWPRFVFGRHLSGKPVVYQFAFCVTVQTVLINTVVLGLGLLHILNRWTVRAVFYGALLVALYQRLEVTEERTVQFLQALSVARVKLLFKRLCHSAGGWLRRLWCAVRARWPEYLLLGAVAVYALIYFSWGVFQTTVYSYPDLYTHHAWIHSMIEGKVFSAGVYPEAMHCLLYTIHTLLGVEVYSLLLFFGSIQSVAFLAACYFLLRELFQWAYTPIFVLAAFLLLGAENEEVLAGMSRLQAALPLEFALTAQMICVLFLLRYLRGDGKTVEKGRFAGFILNQELFVFMMALASILASHFHPVIKAFVLCMGAVAFHLKKVFSRERFLPLAGAVLCGVLIAAAPMAAGLASGIPMQESLDWAIGVINGEDDPDRRDSQLGELDKVLQDEVLGTADKIAGTASFLVKTVRNACGEFLGSRWAGPFLVMIAALMASSAVLWALQRFLPPRARDWIQRTGIVRLLLDKYLLLAVFSLIMTGMYILPYLGLPELIIGRRLVTTQRILIFAAAAIPLDFLFAILLLPLKPAAVQAVSVLGLAAACVWAISSGSYHGYLYCDLTRYPAEVAVMVDIIQRFPQHSYTVVSPTNGLYQVAAYGRHEETLDFIRGVSEERYFLPTEYVFVFVEKRPLVYAQPHYASGPSWLADPEKIFIFSQVWSQHPNVTATEVSLEAELAELGEYTTPFDYYRFERTVVESKIYGWCQRFAAYYPREMDVYYEDDDFVCYYFRQEANSPYDLTIAYEEN